MRLSLVTNMLLDLETNISTSLLYIYIFSVTVRSDNLQSTNDTSVSQQQQQPDYYRERLKILRTRCGLDNEVNAHNNNVWFHCFDNK